MSEPLKTTPLDGLHRTLGAHMVPFAGYAMPLHYMGGILAEHRHTRRAAGLFDVSHMGQLRLLGAGAAAALERLAPGDITGLAPCSARYTLLTNESGGIRDDLIVARREGTLALIVNAATKAADIAYLAANLGREIALVEDDDRALLALQGPAASAVLNRHVAGLDRLRFMASAEIVLDGIPVSVTRSGYTGEDGFELSIPGAAAETIARLLLAGPEVAPIGLGARDTLRLEAGLCLYGHDIDAATTPIEAGLGWTISRRRRAEGGFPGDAVIRRQLAEGVSRRRVGLLPSGRAIARDGAEIRARSGEPLGRVTSGGFAPSLERPIAMGYVALHAAAAGAEVDLIVRGQALPATIVDMPFTPHRYFRATP